ncbi:hypothetical protein [Peijinzhouia sedimentorum]
MIKNSVILLIALLFTQISTFAQSTHVPLNRDYYHLIERYEIKSKGLMPGLFSTVKPLKRNEVAMLADSLLSSGQVWSSKDLFNLQYLADDNWEFSEYANWDRDEIFLDKYRFTGIEDIQRTGDRWFKYQMNPVLGASVGVDTEAGGNVRFMSSIGAEVRGSLFNRVAVYGYFTQNWAVFPTYVQDRISDVGVIPGEGYFDNMGNQGHSFTTPRFNVSTKVAKHIDLQAGFDRNFIGNGHRSMILSDFGNNNFYIKANAKLGHFNYTMIQNVMRADAYGIYGESSIGESFPKKYQAFHRLGIDIGKNFNLGIFETVVYGRERENGANPIELGYMVPAIFFRATEQQVGSADNALLGIDYKWNFLSSFSFYGQVIFDEFVLEEIRSGEGWWANKFGIQTGLKYIDAFGVSNLDLQVEGNITRPYNYTHQDNFNSYTHFLQPIAHPFGTNFKEVVGILRYQPRERLHIVARGFYNQFGADDADTNWGGDILKPYTSREQNYGNVIGQGIDTKILYADLTLSYMLKHNLYADFRTVYRNLTSEISSRDRTTSFTQIGLRLNLSQRDHDF